MNRIKMIGMAFFLMWDDKLYSINIKTYLMTFIFEILTFFTIFSN